MGTKVAKAATIWTFLSDLQRYIIKPQKLEIMQIDNNLRTRRSKKVESVQSAAAILNQEARLSRGEITPMQFLHFMSHKVVKTSTNRSAEREDEGDVEGSDGGDDDDDDDVDAGNDGHMDHEK
jgi:hypothetical protein